MAERQKMVKALQMRKEGASYSQIKERINVSKSTLSIWLHAMPLPEKRLRELRDFNALRIERYRETRRRTREARWSAVYKKAATDIGSLTKRELLIAGLFLYWGEGTKTSVATTSVSNNDPAMICFFIQWLETLGVSRDRLRVYVHLYADMHIHQELSYWSNILNLPLSQFRKPYIKESKRSALSYPQRFTHGTCNLIYENRDISEYVLQSLDYIRKELVMGSGV
jgi:hypothetical protein